ncbi:Protein abhd14b [Halocaridina rubra]|uniref:Protein abhd14b n=1 Tax=Halocaridina rubra TaxID=373956 RepID=A0AAN8X551_HALRR
MVPGLMLNKMPMTPFRVMAVVSGVAAICLVFSALNTVGPTPKLGAVFAEQPKTVKRQASGATMADPKFWQTVNLQAEKIPKEVTDSLTKVTVNTNYINIMGTSTFYREANPPAGITSSGEVAVLLHGMAFKSETWLDLKTIHMLAAMGHRVIAIDLPGFGETNSKLSDSTEPGVYLNSFMTELKADHPVVVSPSMSGRFSFSYILKYPDGLGGFVPVAPVDSEKIVSIAKNISIPTMIIIGEKDNNLGIKSRSDLLHIPTSQSVTIPKGSHPAYLDNPGMFHQLLYNFIKQVHNHRARD